jgi:hypothetical protein
MVQRDPLHSSIRLKSEFETKDSGERVEFDSGMRRDTDKGKPRYDLIPTMPLRRLAELYARGAEKYGDSNWQLADSEQEMNRFRASAFRHFEQWRNGDTDEDHAIAVVWNVFAYLYVEEKLATSADGEVARFEVNEGDVREYRARQRELSKVDL